jgi:CHASE1-domain containing sensor protein
VLGHLGRAAAAYGVLVVGLLLTLLATRFVSQTVEAQERVRFDEAAVATKASVDRRINASYVDTMLGADGLFAASEDVNREEWANYTRAIDLESRYEGLQALGYAPRMAPEERRRSSSRCGRRASATSALASGSIARRARRGRTSR